MTEIASEELRRAHSRAIRRREKWRRDYALLSRAIRETKQRISAAYRANSVDMVAEVQTYVPGYRSRAMTGVGLCFAHWR